jgi:DNA-binding PadR family transcriptional regulator
MSIIRDGILALLTQGPAYGLQLRNELDSRLKRPQQTNVGQVYSTLERLQLAGLVAQSTQTSDGLPLYTLSSSGAAVANEWMINPQIDPSARWDSMVSQVLLVKSLPEVSAEPLIEEFRSYWREALQQAQNMYAPEVSSDLRSSAEEGLCIAALTWLEQAAQADDRGQHISQQRPPRGRPTTSAL